MIFIYIYFFYRYILFDFKIKNQIFILYIINNYIHVNQIKFLIFHLFFFCHHQFITIIKLH